VTDVRVYTAPSVGRRRGGRRGGAVCRLASVYRNDAAMSDDEAPFSLYPGNASSSSSNNNRSNNDNFYDDSRVSLYVVPRDMAAESRDPGLRQCYFLR